MEFLPTLYHCSFHRLGQWADWFICLPFHQFHSGLPALSEPSQESHHLLGKLWGSSPEDRECKVVMYL